MASAEENKRLVRRFYEEIDKGNLAVIDELVAENYLDHNPPPFPGLAPGREGIKQAFKIFWEATPAIITSKIKFPKRTRLLRALRPMANMKAIFQERRAPAMI